MAHIKSEIKSQEETKGQIPTRVPWSRQKLHMWKLHLQTTASAPVQHEAAYHEVV